MCKKKKKIVLEVYLTKIKNYSKKVYNLFVTKNLQSINLDTTFGEKNHKKFTFNRHQVEF